MPDLLIVVSVEGRLCSFKALFEIHDISGTVQFNADTLFVLIQLSDL